MQKLIWQNSIGDEINLTSEPYGITNWEGFSNASINIQSQQVPFQDGGVFLDALIEQRELSVTLAMQDNNNLEKRYEMRRELIHILNPKLGEGYLIYTNDFISKRIKCIAQIPLFETHNSNDSGTPKASLTWTACEPYWEDLEETTINVIGQNILIQNNGDVACGIKAEIRGNVNNGLLIENVTTGQKIDVIGKFSDIKLNTNTGNKNITDKEYTGYKVMAETKSFTSIIFAKGKYYGIANERLFVSEDLYNWDFVEMGSGSFYGILYSAEKDLFLVYGSRLLYSQNAKDWTEVVISASIRKIIYSATKDLFIAVGSRYYITTSPDGIEWTTRNEPVSGSENFIYYDVIETTNNFVACGSGFDGAKFRYSADGLTWTAVSPYFTRDTLYKIVFDGEYYYSGKYYTNDVTSWNYDNNLKTFYLFKDGYYFENTTTGINVYTKTDTTTFELVKTIIPDGDDISINDIIFENGMYYIVGVDLIAWFSSVQSNCFTLNLVKGISPTIKILYAKSKYIVFTEHNIFVSYDLITFTEVFEIPDAENRPYFTDAVYSEEAGMFIAVGRGLYANSGFVVKSIDGEEWITTTTGLDSYEKVFWSPNTQRFYLSRIALGTEYVTTTNGVDFVTHTITETIERIIAGNGIDIIYLRDSVLTSADGEDWEEHSLTNAYQYRTSLVYIPEKQIYFACPSSKTLKSTDGYSWEEYSDIAYSNLFFIDNVYFYTYVSNRLQYSYDMKSELKQISSQIPINSVTQGDNEVICYYSDANGKIIAKLDEEEINIINKLSSNSDMGLKLKNGENRFIIYPKDNILNDCVITYRQKYIGV